MILDVRCVSNPGEPCVETHRVERGGTVRVSGRNLGRAAQLLFYGSKGERDDASAPVSGAAPGSALAAVPASARSGPVAVLDASGRRSLRWTGLVLDDPLRDFGTYQPLGAPSPVRVAVSKPRRIYYGGAQKAVFTYDVIGSRRDGPAGQPRPLQRRPDRAELGSARQRSGRPQPGDLERERRRPGATGRPVCIPCQRARRVDRRAADRPLRAGRRVGLALRARVPGPRQPRLRRRERALRRGPLRSLASGPGRVRQMRHAAGRRPRGKGQVLAASTPRRATTS